MTLKLWEATFAGRSLHLGSHGVRKVFASGKSQSPGRQGTLGQVTKEATRQLGSPGTKLGCLTRASLDWGPHVDSADTLLWALHTQDKTMKLSEFFKPFICFLQNRNPIM